MVLVRLVNAVTRSLVSVFVMLRPAPRTVDQAKSVTHNACVNVPPIAMEFVVWVRSVIQILVLVIVPPTAAGLVWPEPPVTRLLALVIVPLIVAEFVQGHRWTAIHRLVTVSVLRIAVAHVWEIRFAMNLRAIVLVIRIVKTSVRA